MCTGLEVALIGSALLGTAGSVVSSNVAQKNAQRQADARNEALSTFLDKNEVLEGEARDRLQERLAQEEVAPGDAVTPLSKRRENQANTAIDQSTAGAPLTLSGNAPAVVQRRADEAQAGTNAESKRRAAALADATAFGDLLFEKGLATNDAGRDLGTINTFAQANARLLPVQQDLAQQGAKQKGNFLGSTLSALGTLGSTAAGAGVLGGGASPVLAPKENVIRLGFG